MAFSHSKLSFLNLGVGSCTLLYTILCWQGAMADVVVRDLDSNETAAIFPDMQAGFGSNFPKHGLKGRVVLADPETACTPIRKAPAKIDNHVWIVLIKRGGCPFTEKVLNAQKANFCSAIVFNYPGNQGLTKMGGDNGSDVDIPSTFVGFNSGMDLATQYKYPRFKEFLVDIKEEEEIDYRMYLWPFAIVVGVCFVMIMLFLIVKFVRDHTRTRVARLSKKHLKKIPIRKFKKGQYYDTCAICLEEYEDGEKIRVLPCEHAYHAKCIDPWLTRNKKTCPVCKRRVIPGKDPNSDSDTDSEEGGSSQTTPLLMNTAAQRSHGSMNQIDGDSVPAARAQSAPALFEATVVLETEGAVGGIGITHISDGGSSSTSHVGARMKAEFEAERGEQREGRRKRRERKEEEDRLLMATEDDEEEEERRKAERKERRKKKKEKKKKSKKSNSSSSGSSAGGGRGDREGGLVSRPDLETVEEVVVVSNGAGACSSGDLVFPSVGVIGLGEIGPVTEEDGGHANSGFSDSQEVVVPSTRRGKKREMSEVV